MHPEKRDLKVKYMKTKWLSKTECDFCGKDCKHEVWFADARTHNGQWALMCPACWQLQAVSHSFGVGIGQKYNAETLEKIA